MSSITNVRRAAAEDTGLLFNVNGYLSDSQKGHVQLTVDGPVHLQMYLDLHQLNRLILELEETRDDLVDALEDNHRRRNAKLAEPEDAAPGHENLEVIEGLISDAWCTRYWGPRSTSIEDSLLLVGTKPGGEIVFLRYEDRKTDRLPMHIGDRIQFQRIAGDFVRVVDVIPGPDAGAVPLIDWLDLFADQHGAEQNDEDFQWRMEEAEREGRA